MTKQAILRRPAWHCFSGWRAAPTPMTLVSARLAAPCSAPVPALRLARPPEADSGAAIGAAIGGAVGLLGGVASTPPPPPYPPQGYYPPPPGSATPPIGSVVPPPPAETRAGDRGAGRV